MIGLCNHGIIPGNIVAHPWMLDRFDFEDFVGGELTRLGAREDVVINRVFISDLFDAGTQANAAVTIEEGFADAFALGRGDNLWLGVDLYLEKTTGKCFGMTMGKWHNTVPAEKLAAVDVFIEGDRYMITGSQRIETRSTNRDLCIKQMTGKNG